MNREEAIVLIEHTNYTNFNEMALRIFSFQTEKVHTFQLYQKLIGFSLGGHLLPEWIPFLPISTFKSHTILAEGHYAERVYTSSSASGQGASHHHVAYNSLYKLSYLKGFETFYGKPEEWCFLCLLPSYAEREGSSLIAMATDLVELSNDKDSGFFLYNHDALHALLLKKIAEGKKTLLLGVSFALLDFAEACSLPVSNNLVVMETGGMKGRKKEMVRHELHSILTARLGVSSIHSEYGMTELLSQAYSAGDGKFVCPPWMRVFVRDQMDPLSKNLVGQRGRLCVIDLANVYSCSFIQTDDLGIVYDDGSFEVLGRLDYSDTRGCNVMVAK